MIVHVLMHDPAARRCRLFSIGHAAGISGHARPEYPVATLVSAARAPSFAALCGVNPVPASSGKVTRHRLNRGGDRAANSALHIIAIGRLRTDPRSQAYVARRVSEGHSKLEAIRCLKRYIAREVFGLIRQRAKEIAQSQIAS